MAKRMKYLTPEDVEKMSKAERQAALKKVRKQINKTKSHHQLALLAQQVNLLSDLSDLSKK